MDKEKKEHPSKALIVVRLRGDIKTHPNVIKTFDLLKLTRVNHCVVIPKNVNYIGMLQMVKDYATWGEAEAQTLTKVITARGKLVGDIPITDAHVKASTTFATIADFATAITLGKAKYKELKDVKPLFRLHPPMGGIVSVKRSFVIGGDLGNRGPAINKLVERMIGTPKPHIKRVKDLKKWINPAPGGAQVHHEHKTEAKVPAKAPEAPKPKPKPVKKVAAPKAEAKAPKKAKK